jgi:cytochrome c-type biogenesis protein CcmH
MMTGMTTTFWALALLLTAGAVLLLLLPLVRSGKVMPPAAMEEARLTVFAQQLRDLEADLANGSLDATQFERARADLERGLLEDSRDRAPEPGGDSTQGGGLTAVLLALAVPALALATYLQVGSGPAGLQPERQVPAMAASPEHDMDQLLEGLRARLRERPDPQGWALLARSLVSLGRVEQALEAYAEALKQGGDRNPALLAQYADLLASSSGSLQGRPLELVRQALELDPDHAQSLWLAGTAAYREQDYPAARRYWERLLAALPPDSEGARTIENNLRELGERMQEGSGGQGG